MDVSISNKRSVKNRPLYSSVERMYGPSASTGLSRYNNLLAKAISSKKPATSSGFPNIANKSLNVKSYITAKSTFQKGNKGIYTGTMSPMQQREKLMTGNSRYMNESNSIVSRENNAVISKQKVQFRQVNLNTMTSFRENGEARYLYIIPEGSDVTSTDLKSIHINLTDYVEALLPKDDTFTANPKMQRMGPYEKLSVVNPSKRMQKQMFRIILNKLEKIVPKPKKIRGAEQEEGFNYLFTIDRNRITSIFDISKVHKVLLAGKEKYQ